jgi:hypothetical protein
MIISGDLISGNSIVIDFKKDELIFELKKRGMQIQKKSLQKIV